MKAASRRRALSRSQQAGLNADPIAVSAEKDGIGIDVALEWNDSYYENVLCFTNNIPQRDGGTHLAAFRAALTRTLNNYATSSGLMKKEKVSLSGEDMREGLTAIVSVKLPDPKFSSQTKDKPGLLRSPPAARKPDGRENGRMAGRKPQRSQGDHPEDHRRRCRARSCAARPQMSRKGAMSIASLPGKLSDCRERDASKAELFLGRG